VTTFRTHARVQHLLYGSGTFLGMAPRFGGDSCAVEFDAWCLGKRGCDRMLIVHASLLSPVAEPGTTPPDKAALAAVLPERLVVTGTEPLTVVTPPVLDLAVTV